ncbi:unnamed protein product [Lathyrus oleraceus]
MVSMSLTNSSFSTSTSLIIYSQSMKHKMDKHEAVLTVSGNYLQTEENGVHTVFRYSMIYHGDGLNLARDLMDGYKVA